MIQDEETVLAPPVCKPPVAQSNSENEDSSAKTQSLEGSCERPKSEKGGLVVRGDGKYGNGVSRMRLQYKYSEDQWSPINPGGKKQYDREFLLQLQYSVLGQQKPAGMLDIPGIVFDKPHSKPHPEKMDQPDVMDFVPRYKWDMGQDGGAQKQRLSYLEQTPVVIKPFYPGVGQQSMNVRQRFPNPVNQQMIYPQMIYAMNQSQFGGQQPIVMNTSMPLPQSMRVPQYNPGISTAPVAGMFQMPHQQTLSYSQTGHYGNQPLFLEKFEMIQDEEAVLAPSVCKHPVINPNSDNMASSAKTKTLEDSCERPKSKQGGLVVLEDVKCGIGVSRMRLQYKYSEDQWSPTNPGGKKQYDREFLLQLQYSVLGQQKPAGMLDIPDIVFDKPHSKPHTEKMDQPDVMDFVPRYKWDMGHDEGSQKNKWVPRRVENSSKTIDQIHKGVAQEAQEKAVISQQNRIAARSQGRGSGGGQGGDANRFAGWGRGSAFNKAEIPLQWKEKTIPKGNKDIGICLSSQEPNTSTTWIKMLDEIDTERKTKDILNDYFAGQDFEKAVKCVKELPSQNHLHFVRFAFRMVQDRSSSDRKLTGQLLHDLIEHNVLSVHSFIKGLEDVLNHAAYLKTVNPMIWQFYGELMSPIIQDGTVTLSTIKLAAKTLIERTKKVDVLDEITGGAVKRERFYEACLKQFMTT